MENLHVYEVQEIRQRPAPERISCLPHMLVQHPLWRAGWARLEHCNTLNKVSPEPECLLVLGPPGVGKTWLSRRFSQSYPVDLTARPAKRPMLYVPVASPASETTVVEVILRALGDQLPKGGNTGIRTERAIRLLGEEQVEMIFFDDIQHFADRRDSRALPTVSNWLKSLVKQANVACVLIGLHGGAEQVVDYNQQLADLFGDPYLLSPFVWEYPPDKSHATDFQKCLKLLEEEVLPFNNLSGLQEFDLAWRCYVASDGVMRLLMRLIRTASVSTLQQGGERLTLEGLATAFDEELGQVRQGIPNPFACKKLPERRKGKQRASAGVPGGSNNRSHSSQAQRERI